MTVVHAVRADKVVAIFAGANPQYVAERSKGGTLRPESYVFMEGKFTPAFMVDHSLDRCRFETLAKKLAGDLAAQAYYPAKDVETADLLLVVHWGATSPLRHRGTIDAYENRDSISAHNPGAPSFLPDDVEGIVGDPDRTFRTQLEWDFLVRSNNMVRDPVSLQNDADILGITDELRKENDRPFTSAHSQAIHAMLDEERYFVVIMAFDAKFLRETKKLRRLWISKISIRSPGVNFATAVERMGQVGSHYFGTAVKGLQVQTAHIREGRVEVGDAVVIEKGVK